MDLAVFYLRHLYNYNYYNTSPINGLFTRTTWVSGYEKGKKNRLDFNEARDDTVSGSSGISSTICKQFAPCSRKKTTPTPHHSGNTQYLGNDKQLIMQCWRRYWRDWLGLVRCQSGYGGWRCWLPVDCRADARAQLADAAGPADSRRSEPAPAPRVPNDNSTSLYLTTHCCT